LRCVLTAWVALLVGFVGGRAAAAPAWWRVSRGASEVWILGVPTVAPRGMTWDQRVAEQRLRGAGSLIISPRPRGGLAAFGGLLAAAGSLRSAEPMEGALPAPLRRRFVAVRSAIGKDAGHYAGWKPAVAGTFLQADFLKAHDLEAGATEASVRKIGRRAGVREAPAGAYDTAPMIAAAGELGASGQADCLSSELHGLEPGPQPLRGVAQSWARGEISPVAPISPIDQACLSAFPEMKSLADRNLAADSGAVVAALGRSGHAVAVFDLRSLTMTGGILERLRARGLAVSGPQP
jgi:hypothetical protein